MFVSTPISPKGILKEWSQSIEASQVPQAVLLSGQPGAGLLHIGIEFLLHLQCTDKQLDQELGYHVPCYKCESCRAIQQLSHPDIHFTFPVIGTGKVSAHLISDWRKSVLEDPFIDLSNWLLVQSTDNKQGNISRDEVMKIFHDVSLQRFAGLYKVVLIWGAEFLGNESNRLLKLIEEPPSNTVIILITEKPEKVLATITSRCRNFRVPMPSVDAIKEVLMANYGLNEAKSLEVSYTSDGNLNTAIQLATQVGQKGPDIAAWLRVCYQGKGAEMTKFSSEVATLPREFHKVFLNQSLNFVRELGVVCAGSPRDLRLSMEKKEVATKLAKIIDWPQIEAINIEINRMLIAVERNVNLKIAYLASSIRIHYILTQKPLDALEL